MCTHLQIDGLGTASIPRVKLHGRKYLHVTNKRKWVNRLCHSKQCNNIWFIFLIKVQFLKSQVKRSSHVELLHNYFGTWSWNFLQRFSGMCSVLQTSLVSSCLWSSGCPDRRSSGGSGLHSPAWTFPVHIQIFTQTGKNPSTKSAKTSEDDATMNVPSFRVHCMRSFFLVHLQMLHKFLLSERKSLQLCVPNYRNVEIIFFSEGRISPIWNWKAARNISHWYLLSISFFSTCSSAWS